VSVDGSFLRNAEVDASDVKFLGLFANALSKIPKDVLPLHTVRKVHLKRKGTMRGLVGLTKWGAVGYRRERGDFGRKVGRERQTMAFYTDLLHQLSDQAVLAVIAHELAHAWLNEYVSPSGSKAREKEADDLAREWGFEAELIALDKEAYSI
jgi:hypothetical protein